MHPVAAWVGSEVSVTLWDGETVEGTLLEADSEGVVVRVREIAQGSALLGARWVEREVFLSWHVVQRAEREVAS